MVDQTSEKKKIQLDPVTNAKEKKKKGYLFWSWKCSHIQRLFCLVFVRIAFTTFILDILLHLLYLQCGGTSSGA